MEAAAQKKADKTSEARLKLAGSIIQKIAPGKFSLASFVGRPDFQVLPESIKTDVKALYNKVDKADRDLEAVKKSKGKDDMPAECATLKDCVCWMFCTNSTLKHSKTKNKHESTHTSKTY